MLPFAQTRPDSRGDPIPNRNKLTDRSRDTSKQAKQTVEKDRMVVTKEMAVGEVTMNSMSHSECRAGTASDEPAMKTTTVEPTMKTATAEPAAAVRARSRRSRQCQEDAHDQQWDFHTIEPTFLLFGRENSVRQIALRQPIESASPIIFVEHRCEANIVTP